MTEHDSFHIRVATIHDAAPIASIYSEAILAQNATMVLDPVSAEEMADKIESLEPRERILVVTQVSSARDQPSNTDSPLDQDPVCGWGIVKMYSDRPGYRLTCETSIFIQSDFRRKGLGKRLQLALMDYATEASFHHIIVRIWAENHGSIDLHRQVGFSMVGIQNEIGHVDQKWIDVAVMQCLLPGATTRKG